MVQHVVDLSRGSGGGVLGGDVELLGELLPFLLWNSVGDSRRHLAQVAPGLELRRHERHGHAAVHPELDRPADLG